MTNNNLTVFENIVLDSITIVPQTQKEVCELIERDYELKMNSRTLRSFINAINKKYIDGLIDFMILGGVKGVWISQDEKEIRKYNEAKRNHALSELYMSYNANKQFYNNMDLSFNDWITEGNIADVGQ